MRRGSSFFLAAILLVLIPAGAIAQTAQVGVLAGAVKDQTGAVLPGVTVEAKHQEKGFTRSTTTDTAGRFRMAQMPPGPYSVTATLSGFETTASKNNVVETEKTTDVDVTMKLGATTEAIIVTGEVPVVDRTNVTTQTRVRSEEFQKLPMGRSYQSLMAAAPGVIGTGNANVHGALSSNNQFFFDGADTTDPTTGTFGANLNFEAIQEVSILTAGVSAEYGRAVGAVVNVITKSGGNVPSGSVKWLGTNDKWNDQNKTKNEACRTASAPASCANGGDSLARVKFDHVNPTQSYTLGGPFWKDHIWFFGNYEKSKVTSPQRQTVVAPENFQQTTISPFWDVRITAQITPSHNIWAKRHKAPTNGFVIDYWGGSQIPVLAAEKFALTRQDQTGGARTAQWTGIFGSKISAEATWARTADQITVFPYSISPTTNGAPHISLANGFWYNGATFDGIVDRPRHEFITAVSIYQPLMGRTHDIKIGYDWQSVRSGAKFAYPNNQLYIDNSFDIAARTFSPNIRRDYDPPAASISKGKLQAIYARDKFDLFNRVFVEAGLRYEKQSGHSDVGAATVDTSKISPRLSMSYDLRGDGKTLLLASAGRFYQFIIQNFSDNFAQVPQQGNYTTYNWNGTQFVQGNRVTSGGSSFRPNTDLDPTYTNEFTLGFQRQIGNAMGIGLRGIYRKWGDLIDDIRGFNPDGTTYRQVVNYGPAKRTYRALEATFERRFSAHWNANASYTYSRARGNHFENTFSSLGDWLDAKCTTSVDPTIGTSGTIPCSIVQEGSNKTGRAPYDRPHDVKATGAYTFNLGPVSLVAGMSGEYISGVTFTPQRTLTVINPVTGKASGATAAYFYEERGSRRIGGWGTIDNSIEATYRIWKSVELGLKGEVFNITNNQKKSTVNNQTWCANTTNPSASCTSARNLFGTATARGSFLGPRSYRITTLIRF